MEPGVSAGPIQIPVKRGGEVCAFALVDASEAWALAFEWRLLNGYVFRRHPERYRRPGCAAPIYLHREILKAPKGLTADHRNHDKLDNRRANLRILTQAQNNQNAIPLRAASGHRNVHKTGSGSRQPWKVRIQVAGRSHTLGSFSDPEAAAQYARAMRRKYLPYAID